MIYKRHHSIDLPIEKYEQHFGSIAEARKRCFNIGAGTWQHDAWSNIDLPAQSEEFAKIQAPCIHHNLVENKELPIQAGSAELIYTSHVIEHLPDQNVQDLFKSARGSLKEGGILRVVTGPDADTDLAAVTRHDNDWWYFYGDDDFQETKRKNGPLDIYDKWLLHVATPRSIYSETPCQRKYTAAEVKELLENGDKNPVQVWDMLTGELSFNVEYPGDHLSWWNGQKLIETLLEAGFSVAEKSAYGQSRSKFMRDLAWFDSTYPQISLYVEAIK